MFQTFVFASTPVTCGQNVNALGSSERAVLEARLKVARPKEQNWPRLPFFTASQHKQQLQIQKTPSAVSILTFSIFPTTQSGVLRDVCTLCAIIVASCRRTYVFSSLKKSKSHFNYYAVGMIRNSYSLPPLPRMVKPCSRAPTSAQTSTRLC